MQRTAKVNFSLDVDVIEILNSFESGKRSKIVNEALKKYFHEQQREQMIEGFKQESEDFETWEQLGLETWN